MRTAASLRYVRQLRKPALRRAPPPSRPAIEGFLPLICKQTPSACESIADSRAAPSPAPTPQYPPLSPTQPTAAATSPAPSATHTDPPPAWHSPRATPPLHR